jgi:hypothetical protein
LTYIYCTYIFSSSFFVLDAENVSHSLQDPLGHQAPRDHKGHQGFQVLQDQVGKLASQEMLALPVQVLIAEKEEKQEKLDQQVLLVRQDLKGLLDQQERLDQGVLLEIQVLQVPKANKEPLGQQGHRAQPVHLAQPAQEALLEFRVQLEIVDTLVIRVSLVSQHY